MFFKRKQSRVQPANSAPRRELEQTIIPPSDPAFEARVLELGTKYLEHARSGKASILSKGFWSDKLMDWSMTDEDFKVHELTITLWAFARLGVYHIGVTAPSR